MQKKTIHTLYWIAVLLILLGAGGCSERKTSNAPTTETFALTNSNLTVAESPNTSKSPVSEKVQELPVLYYHSVMLEEGNEVRMPPLQFEAQMSYLREEGYETITLDQLYKAFYEGGVLPAKPVVITFDDGYLDNYTNAFPILKRYGFTASVFMVSGYIGGEGFMSWPQLKELSANGWEIEGHTVNHPYLTQMDRTIIFNELRDSKETLEKGLGKPVKYFAYPYGDLNTDITKAVKDTGYLMAFTTARGWVEQNFDQYHLQRVYCYANMGLNEFARRIQDPNY